MKNKFINPKYPSTTMIVETTQGIDNVRLIVEATVNGEKKVTSDVTVPKSVYDKNEQVLLAGLISID